MKFLCDQMFGTLAKWLRLCGFDTTYEKTEIDDDGILKIADVQHRTILSRDRELIQRAEKRFIPAYLIQTHDITEQLHEVLSKTGLSIDEEQMLTRCSVCNHPIHRIDKDLIIKNLPPKVAEIKETFWRCPSCKRIYWKGTHYEKIKKTIHNIQKNS